MLVHSPREIISTAGKAQQDARQKRKRSWKLLIHISNKSASIKPKDVPTKSLKILFEINLTLFKILQIKNIPSHLFESVHSRHEWAQQKSTGCKVVVIQQNGLWTSVLS